MTGGWQLTAAAGRAAVTGAVALALALVTGSPGLVVIGAPFAVLAALALVRRPRGRPQVDSRIDHATLVEGQGTTSRLTVTGLDDPAEAEVVTRVAARPAYVVARPAAGQVSALVASGLPDVEVSPRRWGRPTLGEENVALFSRWAGYRAGPARVGGRQVRTVPATAAYDSRAEAPQPLGLVGAHRSRRPGSGTELAGIRPFHSGDRLRRVDWRVTLRTGGLHVVETRAEEDTGVLLVVDALTDEGPSDGVDGRASSLDLAVRAASALAEHHVRRGDRVALRVVGGGHGQVGYGGGARHLRRIRDQLAAVEVGAGADLAAPLQLGVTGGAVVVVLSPMLAEPVATLAATLTRRGVAVLVVDTLPTDAGPQSGPDLAAAQSPTALLAWRMRRLDRSLLLERLAALGCPVVAWRGPGTLDAVLRRLARRAELPRVVRR